MTHIRYVGAETRVETFGKTFSAGEWSDDSGLTAEAVAILSQNPQFVVTVDPAATGEDAGEAPALRAKA